MASIISPDLLEDELNALIQAGGYNSREEAVSHALEVLLAANPDLRIKTAVELYSKSRVTLSRAAEIAGLELQTFKDKLAEKDVPIQVDESPNEIRAGADLINRLRQMP
jgi:predicted HTH domain antitoxin